MNPYDFNYIEIFNAIEGIAKCTLTLGGAALAFYVSFIRLPDYLRASDAKETVHELFKEKIPNWQKTEKALEQVTTGRELDFFIKANALEMLFLGNISYLGSDVGYVRCRIEVAKAKIISKSKKDDVPFVALMPSMAKGPVRRIF